MPITRARPPDTNWRGNFKRLVEEVHDDDLVWIRDRSGVYYLGRITGEWRYEGQAPFVAADTVNVRGCEWVKVGLSQEVPGKVRNYFNGRGQTLQIIKSPTSTWASKALFNRRRSAEVYSVQLPEEGDILELLGDEELEDVVAVYLQVTRDYMVWPTTKLRSQPRYEFVLVRGDGVRAYPQVKGGGVSLTPKDYADLALPDTEVFLFAASGLYAGTVPPGVYCIDPGVIREFIGEHLSIMPPIVALWHARLSRSGC